MEGINPSINIYIEGLTCPPPPPNVWSGGGVFVGGTIAVSCYFSSPIYCMC
jgi:hypothetical protein